MKKIIQLIFIPVLLFLPAPYALPQSSSGPAVEPTAKQVPVIKFEEEHFDVGDTWEGEKASHTFTFKNIGDAVLKIKKVKTSCGCTAAVLSSQEIKPGETGEIKATFNTKRYRGKQSKTIYVSSNDPGHSTVQLKLQATVKSAATFKPRNLQFGKITRGEKVSRVIELIPDTGSVKILELSTRPDVFTAQILAEDTADNNPEGGKNRPIRIEVSVSPEAAIGRQNGNLTVKIDHPKISSLSARLYLRVKGPIEYSPRMLFFDESAQKNQSAKKVRITKTEGKSLKILGVESTSPQFQAEKVTIRAAREFDIAIRMAPEVEPGRYQGEIVVKTDCPGQEEIKIPVRSNIRKK